MSLSFDISSLIKDRELEINNIFSKEDHGRSEISSLLLKSLSFDDFLLKLSTSTFDLNQKNVLVTIHEKYKNISQITQVIDTLHNVLNVETIYHFLSNLFNSAEFRIDNNSKYSKYIINAGCSEEDYSRLFDVIHTFYNCDVFNHNNFFKQHLKSNIINYMIRYNGLNLTLGDADYTKSSVIVLKYLFENKLDELKTSLETKDNVSNKYYIQNCFLNKNYENIKYLLENSLVNFDLLDDNYNNLYHYLFDNSSTHELSKLSKPSKPSKPSTLTPSTSSTPFSFKPHTIPTRSTIPTNPTNPIVQVDMMNDLYLSGMESGEFFSCDSGELKSSIHPYAKTDRNEDTEIELFNLMIENSKAVIYINTYNIHKMTPIHVLLKDTRVICEKYMSVINHKLVDLNLQDRLGCTPIHYLIINHVNLLELVDRTKVDYNVVDCNQKPYLIYVFDSPISNTKYIELLTYLLSNKNIDVSWNGNYLFKHILDKFNDLETLKLCINHPKFVSSSALLYISEKLEDCNVKNINTDNYFDTYNKYSFLELVKENIQEVSTSKSKFFKYF